MYPSILHRFALGLALTGCATSASAQTTGVCVATMPRLDDGASISVGRVADLSWVPVLLSGAPVPEGSEIFLSVDAHGKVSGHTGCNRMMGVADMDAGYLSLGPLATGRMACDEPLMALEKAYLAALSEVRGFAVGTDGNLYLSRPDGSVALCLRP